MSDNIQILFRTPRRLANQFNREAESIGVSRNQWILMVLSRHLHGQGKTSVGLATLQSCLQTQLMIEAWLSNMVDPSAIQNIRQLAKKKSEKYYDS